MAYIKNKKSWELPEAEATNEQAFWSRRKFLQTMGIGSVGGAAFANGLLTGQVSTHIHKASLEESRPIITPQNNVTAHHNFVEFSQWNGEVNQLAQSLDTSSWPIKITGMIARPMTLEAGELINMMKLEQRVYRFRCIEGWAMVVPWSGFPLNRLLEVVQPERSARYVRFDSFYAPTIAPGQQQDDWHVWPYTEALSIEEASHELSFVATGAYGQNLPKEQGAPLRLVVPWKYALKSIKSITRIEFTDKRPRTFWELARSGECDFNCIVDPDDPHSKLSQQREILIDTGDCQSTQFCNGYAQQVSSLYT